MILRSDTTVADALNTPSPGIYVTVKDVAGNLATIYSDDGVTPKANPFTSGLDGTFSYYAAEGAYTEEYRRTLGGQPTQVVAVELKVDNVIRTDLAAATGATLVGSTGPSTVQADLNARPTSATLAAIGGAALIGSTGPSTVQADITARPTSAALAASGGAALVGFSQSGTGAVARTVADKLGEIFTAADLTGVIADGTDQTTALATGIVAHVATTDRKTIIIPPGMVWHPQALFADVGVAARERLNIIDLSGQSAARKAGENTKIFGLYGVDTDATEDTYWTTASGHHPVFMLNNMNTSATTSAQQGFMSLLYARGFFTDGTEDNREFKGAMIAQFRRSVLDTTIWEHVWRSLAPWGALADGVSYTRWTTLTAYGVGDYVVTDGSNIYKCTIAGTTGASYPTHTSGTATDGTVTWQYVDNNDRLVFGFDQHGRVKSNGASVATDLAAFKQASTDSTATATLRVSGTGTTRAIRFIAEPTDGAGAVVAAPDFTWTTGGILEMRDGGGGLAASLEGNNKGLKVEHLRLSWDTATDLDATPSVTNVATLYVSNSGATNITALTNGSDGQVVEIIATNGNTTLVHSATLMLTGSVNQTLTTYSSITFRKVPTGISDRWVEVARSIK